PIARDRVELCSKSDATDETRPGNQRMEQQRQRLCELAQQRFSGTQLQTFLDQMPTFERRIGSGPPPLTADNVARTYEQIARLLSDTGPRRELNATIGAQVLGNAANPAAIDQFPFPTCQTAVMEKRMYTRRPEEAARLVADM